MIKKKFLVLQAYSFPGSVVVMIIIIIIIFPLFVFPFRFPFSFIRFHFSTFCWGGRDDIGRVQGGGSHHHIFCNTKRGRSLSSLGVQIRGG